MVMQYFRLWHDLEVAHLLLSSHTNCLVTFHESCGHPFASFFLFNVNSASDLAILVTLPFLSLFLACFELSYCYGGFVIDQLNSNNTLHSCFWKGLQYAKTGHENRAWVNMWCFLFFWASCFVCLYLCFINSFRSQGSVIIEIREVVQFECKAQHHLGLKLQMLRAKFHAAFLSGHPPCYEVV